MVPTAWGYSHHGTFLPTLPMTFLIFFQSPGIEYWQIHDPASAANTKECAADVEDPTCSASFQPSLGIDPAHVVVSLNLVH